MNSYEGWIIFSVQLVIVILLLCTVFGLSIRKLLQRNQRLQDQLLKVRQARDRALRTAAEQALTLPEFLKREWRLTALTTPSEGSIEATVRLFRLHWLDAERRALRQEGHSPSDQETLLSLLTPIFRAARERLPETEVHDLRKQLTAKVDPPLNLDQTAQEKRPPLQATMQQLYLRLAEQQQQLESLRQQFSDDHLTSPLLEKASETAEQQNLQAQRLEDSLYKTRQAVEHTRSQLQAGNGDTLLVQRERHQLQAKTSDIPPLQQAFEVSRTELARLQETNRDQRNLIFELESRLSTQTDNDQIQTASALQQLKLQLRDYQTCTQILEWETDDLRALIDELRTQSPPEAEEEAEGPIDSDAQIQLILQAPDYDHLANALRACCKSAGWDSQFLLYGHQQTLQYSSGQPGRELKALRSLEAAPNQPWTTLSGHPAAIFSHLRIVLQRSDTLAKPHQQLQTELSAANVTVSRLSKEAQLASHNTSWQQCLSTSQKAMQDINQQQQRLSRDCNRALTALQKELQDRLQQLPLTDLQRRILESTVTECQRQIENRLSQSQQISNAYDQQLKRLAEQRPPPGS